MRNKKILWLTADCFIDVDRQLVPYLRSTYQLNIKSIVDKCLDKTLITKDYRYGS